MSDGRQASAVGHSLALRRILWRGPLVKATAGLALGLLTALIVVTVGRLWFPQISESGIDAGLRLKWRLDKLRTFDHGMPLLEQGAPERAAVGFVFLDLDPERPEGMPTGCESLGKTQPARYVAAAKRPVGGDPAGRIALDCAATRPFDRHLLSEVVRGLHTRGARLIVLDVVLAEGDATEVQSRALHDALVSAAASPTGRVLYAAPVQPLWGAEGHTTAVYQLEASEKGAGKLAFADVATPTVAIPAPDLPIRRYPRCAAVVGETAAWPTLPQRIAEAVLGQDSASRQCDDPGAAPRIIYTLPPLDVHQDSGAGVTGRENWAHFRSVLDKCLIGRFWDAASRCGSDASTSVFAGKVVVVGASNPVRRDWHYTPLGNMVGPEVVVNAARSFMQFPQVRDKTFLEMLASKCWIVAVCSLVWFFFHVWRFNTVPQGAPSAGQQRLRGLKVVGGFLLTLSAVVLVTLFMSYDAAAPAPSLDILIGVLAISLEQYVEGAQAVVHRFEHLASRVLGGESSHESS